MSALTIAKIEEEPERVATWHSIFRLSTGILYRPGICLSDNQEYWRKKRRGQPKAQAAALAS